MDNSNTTASINTSKSTTTPRFIPAASQTTFDIGDVVLCPSLSSFPFVLTDDPYGNRDLLTLEFEGGYHYYDEQGYFVRADDHETGDFQPSLYPNTPTNQQAVNTLYGNTSVTPSSQRTLIDITQEDDNEVIILPTDTLSDIACDISGAINVLKDIGNILHLIQQDELSSRQTSSMARLTNDATDRWTAILGGQLDAINEAMTQSKFEKVGE